MDSDIQKENVEVNNKQFQSLLDYKPNRPIAPMVNNNSINLYSQEEAAAIRAKKIREVSNRESSNLYPWETDADNEKKLKETDQKKEEKKEKIVHVITPARLREVAAKNKSNTSYVITSSSPIATIGGSNYSMITPPKYSGSIGQVKKYEVSGKPDIFIQEINPLSIRINFEVNSDGSFVRRNVGEWMGLKFNNFMNFSFFENNDSWPKGAPTGQFIANGRNYGAKTDKGSSWSNQSVIVIRPGKVPVFDTGANWYNASQSNEIFGEKSKKHGFISPNINQIQGESVVAANTPLFFERGTMRLNFQQKTLGPGAYNPRGFVGSLKTGKWFVGTTGGGGDRKLSKNGYDTREVAEALNKIYINQIQYALGTDSGGSTSFVSNGNVFEGSKQGRALPTILSW